MPDLIEHLALLLRCELVLVTVTNLQYGMSKCAAMRSGIDHVAAVGMLGIRQKRLSWFKSMIFPFYGRSPKNPLSLDSQRFSMCLPEGLLSKIFAPSAKYGDKVLPKFIAAVLDANAALVTSPSD